MPSHTSRPTSLFETAYTARDPHQNRKGNLRFPPQLDMRVDSPALSGKGSQTSSRTSGGGWSHEEILEVASWLMSHSERHQFPRALLIRTRFPETSLNVTLWMKSQHEEALTPQLHSPDKFAGSKYNSTSGPSPREQLERQAEFHSSTQEDA